MLYQKIQKEKALSLTEITKWLNVNRGNHTLVNFDYVEGLWPAEDAGKLRIALISDYKEKTIR